MASLAEQLPRLEKYEVLEEIGHGGMATVYRARDKRLGRDVALKVIHKHLRANVEVAARFVAEARAVAKLKHPSIVEVYDVSDEAEEERYLIVELVPGTTLRKLLAERGHMPAEVAAALGIEIGSALEHAHQQGVVHRDVKPENVLVDLSERSPSARNVSTEHPADREAGRVKITDFGIAKLLDAQGVTSTGQVLGSPAHMAPEQIEGGDVTGRADVFGMGVLLYECMVGRLPFDGKNPAQVLRKVLDGTFTPPERARPSVGAGFSRIVEKALARNPEDRFESCAELCNALRAELDSLGFDSPRRELAEYITSPESYLTDYERRIVSRLVERGKKARSARQAPLAAAYFNRALAFRPDDAELLKQVAGLAQTERMKRLGTRAAAAVGIALVFATGAYGISKLSGRAQPEPTPTAVASPEPPRLAPVDTAKPKPSAEAPAPSASVEPEDKPKTVQKPIVAPVDAAANGKTRRIRVVIKGPAASRVMMDGREIPKNYEAVIGPHTFIGVPPNEDCCMAPKAVSVEVKPGDGEQEIFVSVPWREATLALQGPEGSYAMCGELGRVDPGAPRKLKPERDNLRYQCTIYGPPGSEPKPQSITLGPGRNVNLTYP